jgi:adenylate kinase
VRLVLLGPPGCGKGTQAEKLFEEFKPVRISTGDMLRNEVGRNTDLGKKAKALMDRGELVPDETIVALIRKRLKEKDASAGYILDGFPRTVAQAQMLDLLLKERRERLDGVIAFELKDEVIVDRLSARRSCPKCCSVYNLLTLPPGKTGVCDSCGTALVLRDDDKEETIRERLRVYRRQTEPLKEYYRKSGLLQEVDADGTANQVYERVRLAIGRSA